MPIIKNEGSSNRLSYENVRLCRRTTDGFEGGAKVVVETKGNFLTGETLSPKLPPIEKEKTTNNI